MLVAADVGGCTRQAVQRSNRVAMGSESHIGFGRHANQDTFWVAPDTLGRGQAGCLMAVADGMGGHKGGGYASQYACKLLHDYYRKLPRPCIRLSPAGLCRHLTDLIFRIDRRLRLKALASKDCRDMGTTLSCLAITATHSIIGHVGDSRIYRWRNGHLTCLTMDHTFVQEMITEGEIDPQTAGRHPLRHMLTQAVGTAEPLEHVLGRMDAIKTGDRFLLCTDGLHNSVSDDQICRSLAQDGNAEDLAASLLSRALANKTRDNVTVLVATVDPSIETIANWKAVSQNER